MLKISPAGHRIGESQRLWSLRDIMKPFDVSFFAQAYVQATSQATVAGSRQDPLAMLASDIDQHVTKTVLEPCRKFGAQAGLVESLAFVERFKAHLANKNMNYIEFQMQLCDLLDLINSEMEKILFLSIPARAREIFDKEKNFGERVYNAFPSARMDIQEAGSCLASERYNGAVYHLCCAAEVGLRALAHDRRVTVTNMKGNPLPLEFAQWGKIIEDLRKKVDQIGSWKAGKIRDAAHIFYNNALVEVQAFNDGYRRHVMHSRNKKYGETEALGLYVNIKRFLETLSEKISEGKRTPIKWTRAQL
jgi:hypothetical protein